MSLKLAGLLGPFARILQPKLYGLDNVPGDGVLLVGNHTIFAFLDLPFLIAELWKRRGLAVRGLGDNAHYAIPLWRDVLELCGMVRGTRENVDALVAERQTILVFPGGAREVNKRRGEAYQLMWKERLGFAKLAIAHGYPIVPFAAVGAEEMLSILVDEDNPAYAQLAAVVKKALGWPLQPLVRGIGPTPIPRPERLYFWFGEPIDTAAYAGSGDDGARALRDEVRAAVEHGLAFLHDERDNDPDRPLAKRLRRRVGDQGARR
jgi:1-acyl-sn-glycerol-3-phosphate acyltransferase